jgi:hypothetical protein
LRRIKFPNAISSARLLAKEMSSECFIKLSMPKECLKSIFQKLCCKSFSLILKRDYLKPKFYLHYANKNPWQIHIVFIESCFNYENMFITVLYCCFEFLETLQSWFESI